MLLLMVVSFLCSAFDAQVFPRQQTQGVLSTAATDQQISSRQSPAIKTYSSIEAAIAAAPDNGDKPYQIFIAAGNYYEKLIITKPHIQLLGEGEEKTRIYYDAYAGQTNPDTGERWGTRKSATVTVRATDFVARNIHIENSFDYPTNEQRSNNDPSKVSGMQAVALVLDNGSDRALFNKVTLSGYQDTFYTVAGRSLFINSTVKGHIDFIFGGGTAVFLQSDIVTRARQQVVDPIGFIAAPSTQITQPYGLIFKNSRLLREGAVADNSMALGRPWHPTTTFPDGRYADPNAIGQAVYINCWMDAHIKTNPWYPMGGSLPDGSRTEFQPDEARFFEFGSTGPGAKINGKRRQLTPTQAEQFTLSTIFKDWQPMKTASAAGE